MTHCSHIRVRNFNVNEMDVEAFIKYVEKKYNKDVRDLPQWKELVGLLHHNTTDYKRAVHASKERKRLILEKILIQTTRMSPFELTDNLSRTHKVWEDMKIKTKTKNISLTKLEQQNTIENLKDIITNDDLTAHPNSEIIEEDILITTRKDNIDIVTETITESYLPTVVCVNKHKVVSPLESKDSRLIYQSVIEGNDLISEKECKEWLVIEHTKNLRSRPAELFIIDSSMKEQKILFTIVNCGTKYKHIRFVTVTDTSQFKYIKISPIYPVKLIPGISVQYCLKFRLLQNTHEFSSALFFRIGRNVVLNMPGNALLIPIQRRLTPRSVSITEIVNLPPAYPWHISGTIGYPTGTINILCEDPYNYEVQITKRALEYDKEPEELSVQVVSLNTDSVKERKKDDQMEEHQMFSGAKSSKSSKISKSIKTDTSTSSTKNENEEMQKKNLKSKECRDIVFLIVEEIISTALDSFTIDRKNVELRPYSKETITVWFTKHEHIGYHQCFYDVDVYDLNSRDLLMTKTVQVRAEVLPHPVSIFPTILDMSTTAVVTHGFVEDKIVFYNNHRIYPVYVKVKLTTKMKKVFEVAPSELVVHPLSSGPVIVRFCTRSFLTKNVTDELAFFTVKVLYSGNQTVYNHVPPVFYEIIAPCAFEFKQYYNEKYYKDSTSKNISKNRNIKLSPRN